MVMFTSTLTSGWPINLIQAGVTFINATVTTSAQSRVTLRETSSDKTAYYFAIYCTTAGGILTYDIYSNNTRIFRNLRGSGGQYLGNIPLATETSLLMGAFPIPIVVTSGNKLEIDLLAESGSNPWIGTWTAFGIEM